MKKQYGFLALLAIISFVGCSKQKYNLEEESTLNTVQQSKMISNTENAFLSFQLVSFTAQYGGTVKWGRCRVATAIINWTAMGETNVDHYDLQRSDTSNAFGFYNIATFPSSNNDQSISRSFTNWLWGNGATLNTHYRLQIFYTNNTNNYSTVKSVTVKTPRCDQSGF